MSKKGGFSVFALTLLAGTVLFYGMRHVENEKEELLKNDTADMSVAAEGTASEGSEAKDSLGKAVDVNRLSLEQYLKYKAETTAEARLAFYGDVSLERTGISKWNEQIKEALGENLVIEDATYPEYDTYELYIQQTTSALAEIDSDAILFFLPAYPDKDRDMGLAETKQYLSSIIERIQTSSPDSLFILVEPHPMGGEAIEWNSRSLDYVRYLETMREVINEEGLPIFSIHDSFSQEVENQSLVLAELYAENGIDLNEEGERVFTQIFNEWAEQELDTRSFIE